ncbi:MAG: hypothetical protein U5L01_06890 [Rheinheimera sp.]|nr:hypothetical protein [Rheinheimera sp.]
MHAKSSDVVRNTGVLEADGAAGAEKYNLGWFVVHNDRSHG